MKNPPNEWDKAEAKDKLKSRYRVKTGEELPDHVLENLDLLQYRTGDIEQALEYQAQAEQRQNQADAKWKLYLILIELGISGLVGLYASRWFSGTLAQIAGGVNVALITVGVLFGITWLLGTVIE